MTVTLTSKSATQTASLGTALILLEGSDSGEGTCSTEGDAAGVVLLKGEWRTVLDLAGGGPYVLILITPAKELVSCTNGLNYKLKGSVLSKVSPFATGEVTAFKTETQCDTAASRKAKWKEYDSDTAMATAKLEANAGLGYEEVCEEAKEAMSLTATSMQEIMSGEVGKGGGTECLWLPGIEELDARAIVERKA